MGKTSFRLAADFTPAEAAAVSRATLCGGYDLAPVPSIVTTENGVLTLQRDADESGYLACPWPDGGGESMILTSTLRERDEHYNLALELARGRVNQIRNQVADWRQMGFELHSADLRSLKSLVKVFAQSVVAGDDSAAGPRTILAEAARLADRFATQFAAQLAESRFRDSGPLDTKMGLRLGQLPPAISRAAVTSGFTALRLVPSWRAIEPTESTYDWKKFDALVDWATGTGLTVSIGPVIDLAGSGFPDWVRQWDSDLPSLAAFFCDFAEQLASRYGRKVDSWQILAGFNHSDQFGLGEDDRLRLAARLQDCARSALPEVEFILGLSQPWGDYLTGEDYTYSPLLFADTMIRAGFSFAAVELELFHAPPGQGGDRVSTPRDALSVYKLCELFSILSIPLELSFARPLNDAVVGPELEPTLALSLALQRVRAVNWEAWSDGDSPRVEGAALGQTLPRAAAVKKLLREFRVKYLA